MLKLSPRRKAVLGALLTVQAGLILVSGCQFALDRATAEETPRTVVLGIQGDGPSPEEWTAAMIRDGWAATDAADRARVCAATPDQLRAAAPHTSYDPALYRVETAITVLGHLCAGK